MLERTSSRQVQNRFCSGGVAHGNPARNNYQAVDVAPVAGTASDLLQVFLLWYRCETQTALQACSAS